MSKKRKSLADQLAGLINPAPEDFDPEDADGQARVVDMDDDFYGDSSDRMATNRRSMRVEQDIADLGRAYGGKVSNRKAVFGDDSEDDMPKDEGESDSDDTGAGFGQDQDSEDEGDMGEGSEGDEAGSDGEDEDGSSLRGMLESSDAVAAEQEQLRRDLQALNSEEQEQTIMQRASARDDLDKARHVQAQRAVWESLVHLRIRLHNPLQTAHRLPQPDTVALFEAPLAGKGKRDASASASAAKLNKRVAKAYQAARASVSALMDDLSLLQAAVSANNEGAPALEALSWAEAKALDQGETKARPSGDYWEHVQDTVSAQQGWYEQTIEKWNRKTQQAAGGSVLAGKNFKVINQSVMTQIQNVLADEERLIRRSQTKRSDFRVVGKRKRDPTSDEAPGSDVPVAGLKDADAKEEWDEEIYDDTDFYQLLLRDIIDGTDASGGGDLLSAVRQAKKKSRKTVDRRASKGRKIRYTVLPKLVNFMAPVAKHNTDSFLAEELFKSLFGGSGSGQGLGARPRTDQNNNEVAAEDTMADSKDAVPVIVEDATSESLLSELNEFASSSKLDIWGEQFAIEMDKNDPVAKFRAEFSMARAAPHEEKSAEAVYLTGNSLGLMPKRAHKYVSEEMQKWGLAAVEGHFAGPRPWARIDEFVTGLSAQIVGAKPDEVAVMNSLSVNLHLLLTSFYRPSGRRVKLLIDEGAFCSDHHVARSQVRLHGLDPATALIQIPARAGEFAVRTEDILAVIEREGEEIATLLLPGVSFYTGQLFDMAAITAAAHKKGIMVGFDLAHAAGNVPLALHAWGVDFAAWCTYKYLNSGPGAIAGAFVHERHAQKGASELLRLTGWWGQKLEDRFAMLPEWQPKAGAQSWQISNPAVLPTVCLQAALELHIEAGGMRALRAKSLRLTRYLEALLQHELISEPSSGLSLITPRDPRQRGAQLSILLDRPVRPVNEVLAGAGCICDVREPNVMRVSPAPIYNSFHDVYRFVQLFKKALAESPRPTAGASAGISA